jgi:hypothetical protein
VDAFEEAIKAFDATDANLKKLEKLWKSIKHDIPEGVCYGIENEQQYDDKCRDFQDIASALPTIDEWQLPVRLFDINEIAQMRFDALELGEFEIKVHVEETIFEQEKLLQEYRHKLMKKRRQLVREKTLVVIEVVDNILRNSETNVNKYEGEHDVILDWPVLIEKLSELDILMGNSFDRPERWKDILRHSHFGEACDFQDIISFDWPSVKRHISDQIYSETDPIPVQVKDLGELASSNPKGEIPTKLKWDKIDSAGFERLIYCLISDTKGYENPEWLMHTNAPDKGRDLSVMRVFHDALGGVKRSRVIIQCRHLSTKGVNLSDVAAIKEQVKLWEPPRIDTLIIVTSSRFTADAVQFIERHNQSDSATKIEMWPENHLERILASRPAVVAEFKLR